MGESAYPRRIDPKKTIAAISLVIVIVIAAFAIISWPKPKIYIYTYDSFMVWGEHPETIDEVVFGPFEEQYGVDIEIVRLQTDANGIVARLVAESSNPVADVVIGIDNVLIQKLGVKEVLEPYDSPALDSIPSTLVDFLDENKSILPFDYGLVTLIYQQSEINETTHPELASLTFADLAKEELAGSLVTQNPHFSSPGLAFFLSQIAVYEKILEEDWTDWWHQVKDHIDVQQGWTEAWTKWESDPTKHLLVSYGTDPAYSAYWTDSEPDTALALLTYDSTQYAWMQVEGIGLVKNGPNPDIARAFIDYCLSEAVQSHIALNQWMFPANEDVVLHQVFDYAIHPSEVTALNTLLTGTEIADNLSDWLDTYDLIMSG